MANILGSTKQPLEIKYCGMCVTLIKDNACGREECQNAAVKTFLYLHPEIKLAELFSDQKFIKLLKQGKTECKERVNDNTYLYDIYSGRDYQDFCTRGGFFEGNYNISFTLNTDGLNKYKSSKSGNIWPVYLSINELPKEVRFKKDYIIPVMICCDKKKPK